MTEIVVKYSEEGNSITKIKIVFPQEGVTWIVMLSKFVDILNEIGYIIDKSRIEIRNADGINTTLDEI